ncbi:MAG: hypothetical protein NVS3B2_12200 [Ramlibacter sp.]
MPAVLDWLRRAGVLLVVMLTAVLFTGVRDTPAQLVSFYQTFWPRRDAALQDWRTERAGEAGLSARVQAMLALLRENRVQSFGYSAAIASDADSSVVQRLAESAYPIRVIPGSLHLLALSGELQDTRCRVLATRQEVVLALCS